MSSLCFDCQVQFNRPIFEGLVLSFDFRGEVLFDNGEVG